MITRLLKPKSATADKSPEGQPLAATPTQADAGASVLDAHTLHLKERRRFPRPLPVPEVMEDHSDAAWEEFHKISDSNWAAMAAPSEPAAGQ